MIRFHCFACSRTFALSSFRCENRVVEFCLPLIFPEFAELYECVRVYLRTSVHSPFSRFFVCVSPRFKEIVHAFHFANKLEQEQTAFSFSIFVFSAFENGSHVLPRVETIGSGGEKNVDHVDLD